MVQTWHTAALFCRQAWKCSIIMEHQSNGRKSFSWSCSGSNCVQAGFEIIFWAGINMVVQLAFIYMHI